MAGEIPVLYQSFVAGADLTSSAFLVGTLNSSGLIVPQTTAGQGGIGIIQDAVLATRVTSVMSIGVSRAVYGGTVNYGDHLTNDVSGRLVTSTAKTDCIVGIALESGAVNEIHSVFLSNSINSGTAYTSIAIPLQLAAITTATNVLTFTPGYAGSIVKTQFAVSTPASTASKAATLGLAISGTNVTGGAVALTTAAINALNSNVAGSAVTANNSFGATDTITVVSSSVTAFAEGQGSLIITIAQ
ncbi:hypothetical protein [Pectinatus frisingensis]|uniref:hypothetical protein n=1 Tax=Pectinatus frisingensis TaxID=865 RepID=UPI0018C717E9|nr:hypothetical protein [Pectinatus frisingensis]